METNPLLPPSDGYLICERLVRDGFFESVRRVPPEASLDIDGYLQVAVDGRPAHVFGCPQGMGLRITGREFTLRAHDPEVPWLEQTVAGFEVTGDPGDELIVRWSTWDDRFLSGAHVIGAVKTQ